MSDPTKTKMSLVDFGFVKVMAEVLQEGIRPDRTRDDWKPLAMKGPQPFEDALLRHYEEYQNTALPKDKRRQAAKIAVNAMIMWWGWGHRND